jgi:hypothetical protein
MFLNLIIVCLQTGCLEEVQQAMGDKKIKEVQSNFCGSIYNEAAQEVKDGKGQVRDLHQDLFLEQSWYSFSFFPKNFS